MAIPTYWPVAAKERIRTLLETYLVTGVDPDDEAKVSQVVIGKYRNSPARAETVVEVHENDPDDPEKWEHHVVVKVGNENADNRYYDVIGVNRNYWWRRFTIKIVIMMRGESESDAIKGAIISRIERMILENRTLNSLVDDGGEYCNEGRIVMERGEQGGDDRSPIWRHKLWLEFKTIRTQR